MRRRPPRPCAVVVEPSVVHTSPSRARVLDSRTRRVSGFARPGAPFGELAPRDPVSPSQNPCQGFDGFVLHPLSRFVLTGEILGRRPTHHRGRRCLSFSAASLVTLVPWALRSFSLGKPCKCSRPASV